MLTVGLIREGKYPHDNRVSFTPAQCKWINKTQDGIRIIVQSSDHRCFTDREYKMAGIEVKDDVSEADVLMGIKEVPIDQLIPSKTYLFFSHTKKKQPHNQGLLKEIIRKGITLIDYECLEHDDGQRMIGFGFFAGVVGAHNGMMAYGNRTKTFNLERVYLQKSFRELIHTYFHLKLPNVRIVVTGSGRVAHGVLEVMNLMGFHETEPGDFLKKKFSYPVYTQLKGAELYEHRKTGKYDREDFHMNPSGYKCKFTPFLSMTDILMNGVYWDKNVPRLFEKEEISSTDFSIQTIADITDDANGSIPINLGDQTIDEPVYGVDRKTFKKTLPYLANSVDIMAVGNLPNELPRDASRYFGEQLIKYVLDDLAQGATPVLRRATMVKDGKLTEHYKYLEEYAQGGKRD